MEHNFIEKAIVVHGNKYDYSKVEYKSQNEKVCIICPEHGEFWQTPKSHIVRKYGCPKCGRVVCGDKLKNNKDVFIKKAKKVHGGKYDYSNVEYENAYVKVCIICPKHGEFWQSPHDHLKGAGCPDCGRENTIKGRKYNKKKFVEKAEIIHNKKYDYSLIQEINNNEKVPIICPEHGEFWQAPYCHLQGQGCPICGKKRGKLTQEEFEEKSKKIHKGKYKVLGKYEGIYKKIKFSCPEHGEFWQTPDTHLHGCGCPKCGNQISKAENEIYEYCCSLVGKENVVQRCRDVIKPKELDIYIPSMKVAIEYNGLRWHSDKYKTDKRYHYDKLIACKEKGIRLIQVFEDEYTNRKDIVLSKIAHLLGKCEKQPRIMGRKCEICEIGIKEAKDFLKKNHIQGYGSGGVHLGAYFDNNLVGVMIFRKEKEYFWELTRFATDNKYICNGVGGKLFKYFIKNYDFREIKSFADRRWTINEENNIYVQLGFKFDSYTPIEYRYFKEEDGMERQHKFAFRKERLHNKYGLPISMTESEMVKELGYSKVYDCGLIKYVYHKKGL